eukprot:TRINITY_DN32311_c0_g1_i1.p1 TRINITY_DN32311_c0_g1~~TRINITY_DN32311_c0_g1_i1.p1  ORF type:complete len:224 (-),score=72.51 TRINITY_DN32311_c0_g1_i1:5-676(-)
MLTLRIFLSLLCISVVRFLSLISSHIFFFLMIRRPPRSTQGVSSAASDVYKRQYQRRVHGDIISFEEFALIIENVLLFQDYAEDVGRIFTYLDKPERGIVSKADLLAAFDLLSSKSTGMPLPPYDVIKSLINLKLEKSKPEVTYSEFLTLLFYSLKELSLIHISEPTRPLYISYAVFCLKKKKKKKQIYTIYTNYQQTTRKTNNKLMKIRKKKKKKRKKIQQI